MDAVTLYVGELDNMSSYYENALALEPLAEGHRDGEARIVLGRGTVPMVQLVAKKDLPQAGPRQAGLFHSAFLFEDEASLAATVYQAALDPRSRYVGSGDHLVSEAFYFTDPEGNGIELYRDRPREQWQVINGEIQMDTLYIDAQRYLEKHLPGTEAKAMPGVVGHIHLQVGDVPRARDFYTNAIGFDITFTGAPGAVFVSAGGYHHHMAMNTWASKGAGPRAASLGAGRRCHHRPRKGRPRCARHSAACPRHRVHFRWAHRCHARPMGHAHHRRAATGIT